jgi:hypothetical protein
MAVRQNQLDDQLDLFSNQRPTYESVDTIRPPGRETLGEHCPKMVSALEAQGQLHAMLLEAEEKTKDEMIELTQQFRKQGLTAQQAHDRAWEMVRESYILLPAES